jgi:hypothetical protein
MGCDISLSNQQIINIIKLDLAKDYFRKIYNKNIEYYNLPDEKEYCNIIKILNTMNKDYMT